MQVLSFRMDSKGEYDNNVMITDNLCFKKDQAIMFKDRRLDLESELSANSKETKVKPQQK